MDRVTLEHARRLVRRRLGRALAEKASDNFCLVASSLEEAGDLTMAMRMSPEIAPLSRARPEAPADVVLEFEDPDRAMSAPPGPTTLEPPADIGWSRVQRVRYIDDRRTNFYLMAGPVFTEFERSERLMASTSVGDRQSGVASPTEVCWLNRTLRAPGWPELVAEVAGHPSITRVGVPRRLTRELPITTRTVGVPGYRASSQATGHDVVVAVIDGEVDLNHPALAGRVVARRNYTREPWGHPSAHGTAVAGIIGAAGAIEGVAPACTLFSYKVLATNPALGVTDFDGARAIELALADGADVANLSWGVGRARSGSSREARACDEAWRAGMVLVKSAGNRGPTSGSLTSPADASGVIVVGATDRHGLGVQAYSSRGPLPNGTHRPHLVAPGGYGRDPVISCTAGGGFGGVGAGTSFAAPHVSGIVALVLEREPQLSPEEVRDRLVATCRSLGQFADAEGAGLVDAVALLRQQLAIR